VPTGERPLFRALPTGSPRGARRPVLWCVRTARVKIQGGKAKNRGEESGRRRKWGQKGEVEEQDGERKRACSEGGWKRRRRRG